MEKADRLPSFKIFRDVRYVPEHGPGEWGIYDQDEKIGDDLLNNRRPGRESEIHIEDIPEKQIYVYVGLLVLHYGHFIVDTLSRMWPIIAAPDRRMKIICHRLTAHPEDERHDYLYDMLASIGIGRADIISYDEEIRIPYVIFPERCFHERKRVFSVFGDLCRGIGAKHWSISSVDADVRPAYLSKTRVASGMTKLLNEDKLEAELDRLGVEIVYPETMTFAEQVAMLARRKFILGLNSSAFHTTAFSAPNRRIIGLNWSYQLNANFFLFDVMNGNTSHYYWVFKTSYSTVDHFSASWTIPEPERVARELLDRIEVFDRLDEEDRRQDLEIARRERRIGSRVRRWRRRLIDRLTADGRSSGL